MLPAGVDKYTWRLFDENAKAVPMAGHEDGAPVADVDGDEMRLSFVRAELSFVWAELSFVWAEPTSVRAELIEDLLFS